MSEKIIDDRTNNDDVDRSNISLERKSNEIKTKRKYDDESSDDTTDHHPDNTKNRNDLDENYKSTAAEENPIDNDRTFVSSEVKGLSSVDDNREDINNNNNDSKYVEISKNDVEDDKKSGRNRVNSVDNDDGKSSSGYCSTSSPTSTSTTATTNSDTSKDSSPSSSPSHTLKRSKSFRPIVDRKSSISSINLSDKDDRLADIIGWYPALLLRTIYNVTTFLLYVTVTKLPFVLPALWLSGCLWLFLKFVQVPLYVVKSILTILFVSPTERYRKKRTVLISGGSTVQTIHLARNFNSAGARVIVCEIKNRFGLAKFSTAVSKYYAIPKPSEDDVDLYINALKKIVAKENISYYIPVSESHSAYYDALAKPHLEGLNCRCFCPDVRDVSTLDDSLEFMRKLRAFGSTTPPHFLLRNSKDLDALYESGIPESGDHFIVTVGPTSVRTVKRKLDLPDSRRRLKLPYAISDSRPWLAIQDYRGHRYITCTTVRDSRVIANVTCRQDVDSRYDLTPVEHKEIEIWLRHFFANLAAVANRRVTGHVSFLFAVSSESNTVLPLDCQVGVRLPYVCYTDVHPRVVWKPCKHFDRSASGPLVTDTGRYWLHEIILKTVRRPNVEAIVKLVGVLFDRQEALFIWSDPLPYCAFYYLQLPLDKIFRSREI